jgi:hypothetical protein
VFHKKKPSISVAASQFADPAWRLNNLYWIIDRNGQRRKFKFNAIQERLYRDLHNHNVILKARQMGISTFCSLFMLDRCLFNSNVRAGTVAHDLPSAKGIFRDKVRYAYENLPEQLRQHIRAVNDSAEELLLSNNSSLRVATSMRSGTLNYLHVSEFGKICARFPDRAREVITGSLNTLAPGMVSFIESTAEGNEGKFWEMCQLAQTKQRMRLELTPLDAKFHFFPWYEDPHYVAEPIALTPEDETYFDKLEFDCARTIRPEQRAWYVKKRESQTDDMLREFPSNPDEAFSASVEGTYYGPQIAKAESEGRIAKYPAAPRYAVNTAWDIGVGDSTAIWFWQFIRDTGRIRFIGYYENTGEGAEHYVRKLRDLAWGKWPPYGYHFLPHDVAVTEWGTNKTRFETLVQLGIRPTRIPQHTVEDGINGVRLSFANFEFDELACAEGLKALRAYRKEWDEERGCWKDKPRHDWASHGADALRYAVMGHRPTMRSFLDKDGVLVEPREPQFRKVLIPTQPDEVGVTLEDLWEQADRPRRLRI